MPLRQNDFQSGGSDTAWRATVNPRNNLAHCFSCLKNLNNIDLLLTLDYDFRAAITLLECWLNQYQAQQAKKKTPPPPPHA